MSKNVYKGDRSKSLFYYISRYLGVFGIFLDVVFLRYVLVCAYVFFLAVINIANTHYNEKFTRQVNYLQDEVDQLKVRYTSLQAEYMTVIKQSEIAKRVAPLGLVESTYPPFKLSSRTSKK
jgi:hypothetical protein